MRFVGIDPASKTGFVALAGDGTVLKAKELTGVGGKDPKRMVTLIQSIAEHVYKDDLIVIEGFPYATQRAMFAGGLHHGIRNELFKRNLRYYEVAPNAVKKFVGVTGWVGEKGKKKRLTGPQKKKAVIAAVKEIYGFTSTSDNIIDAYIMAQIARGIGIGAEKTSKSISQIEVIESILTKKTE